MGQTLWIRNLQLSIYGVPLSLAYTYLKDGRWEGRQHPCTAPQPPRMWPQNSAELQTWDVFSFVLIAV